MRSLLPEIQVRPAVPADASGVSACVNAAYSRWVPIVGTEPGPMRDDYSVVLVRKLGYVCEHQSRLIAVLIVCVTEEGFLLENVAVDPAFSGRGIGSTLMSLAEHQATANGYKSIYLYTHERMTENIELYSRRGYVEYARRTDEGFARVFMRKSLA